MKKNIFRYILFCFLGSIALFALVSCEEDFLEKPPAEDVTIDTVFANTRNAQQVITSLYHNRFFGTNNVPLNWWGDGWFAWSDMGEDLYFPKAKWVSHWQYVDGTLNPTSKQFYSVDRVFYAVRMANTFLERANTISTVSEDDKKYVNYMRGEAHAHIAYQYFKGFRVWGSLPWVNKVINGGEEAIPRASFNDLIDSIAHHCDLAAQLLPAKWDNIYTGRFTSVAAKALKAKILVYAASDLYNGPTPSYAAGYEHPEVLGYGNFDIKRWERAAQACKESIDAAHDAGHQLYRNAGTNKNITELSLNLTSEHLLIERWPAYDFRGGWRYCFNQMNFPFGIGWDNRKEVAYQPTFQHVDGYQLTTGKFPIDGYTNNDGTQPIISADGIAIGYSDQDFAANRDPRLRQNIVYHGSTFGEAYNTKIINFDIDKSVPNRTHGDWANFVTSFMVRKYVAESIGEASTVKHAAVHAIIRLADIYLLYAEALNRANNGPTADALNYLNEIRSRSGMPNYNSVNYKGNSDMEKFENAIKYERKVEFYLEAQRYFDLRRWKDGKLMEVTYTGASINNGIVSRTNTNYSPVWNDKYYFHPINNDFVNNTPGLHQNPGY